MRRSLDSLITLALKRMVAADVDWIGAAQCIAVEVVEVEEHQSVTLERLVGSLEQATREVALGLPWLFMILR